MAKGRTARDDGEGNTQEIDGSFLTLGVGCSTEAPVDPGISNADVSRSGRINTGSYFTLGDEGNSDVQDRTYDYISNIDIAERLPYEFLTQEDNNMHSSDDSGVTISMSVAASPSPSPGPSSNTASGSGVREGMPMPAVDCAIFNEIMDIYYAAVGTDYSNSESSTGISTTTQDEIFPTFDQFCADLGYDLRARVDTAHRLNSGADLEVNYGLGSGPSSSSTGLAIGARPSRSSQMRHTTSEQSQHTCGVGVSRMPPLIMAMSSSDAQIHRNYDITIPLPPKRTPKRVAPPEDLSAPVPYKCPLTHLTNPPNNPHASGNSHMMHPGEQSQLTTRVGGSLMQEQDDMESFTFPTLPPPEPELPHRDLWSPVADERAGAGNPPIPNYINQTYPPNHPQTAASLPPPPPDLCRPPSSKQPCDYCHASEPPVEATIEDCGHKYHIKCLRTFSSQLHGTCFRCKASQ